MMSKAIVLFALISFNLFAQKSIKDINKVLDDQTQAWNNADVKTFMEGYWKSDNLKFIGKTGVMKSWESTYNRYLKSYPDKETMGHLTFDNLEIELLSKKIAFITGSWHLTRPQKGDIGGYYSLVMKKINGTWKIISDHTS